MDANIENIVKECTAGSDDGRFTFPQVVMKLMDSGIGHYHADLGRGEKTYYMPNRGSAVVSCHALEGVPAEDFSATGVEAAVRAIQRGEIGYREFCEKIAAAGCVGYFVSIAGRRAVYYGRTLETYVEPFPQAK